MPYPRKLLSQGEVVKLDLRPHWLYFLGPALATIGTVILAIVILAALDVTALNWITVLLIAAAVVWLIGRFIRWRNTYFVVTNDKVVYRSGVFRRRGVQIPLERVNSVNFEQNIFERMVGAGDLNIESGGLGGPAKFTDVRHPDTVQVVLHEAIEENATGLTTSAAEMPRRPAGPSDLPPPPPADDVTLQLERLEGLLQRGTITQDEFDAQKRRLLGE
jgi:uncharacterized membrane protein YdbT with pleckstrin-like domain